MEQETLRTIIKASANVLIACISAGFQLAGIMISKQNIRYMD